MKLMFKDGYIEESTDKTLTWFGKTANDILCSLIKQNKYNKIHSINDLILLKKWLL